MSSTRTSGFRRMTQDHFEPEDVSDPQAQRRLRGQLERIDYTVFASNREVIGHALGGADASKFQRLAVAASTARAQWVAAALALSETGQALDAEQTAKLGQLRGAYEELREAYEALRRMVERGYLAYQAAAAG